MDDITETETEEATGAQKNNMSAGTDEITAELLQHGGPDTVAVLTRLMNSCWRGEEVPSDWTRGIIVKLPKKGNTSECNNWRGITLLSVPGKVFCAVVLNRLCDAVDVTLRDKEAVFRCGRSRTEQIFTLCNIIE